MAVIDEVVKANAAYAQEFALADLPMPPARRLAVLACMDARLTVEEMLGLTTGEAHIIRNAGGIATEDSVRSLVISHYLLGTQEFMAVVSPTSFHAFTDLEANVRQQVQKVKSHPWTPRSVPVRGFIYDVKTGTHRGGPLGEGELDGTVVTCPWHGAQFEVTTGQVVGPPAGQSVPAYQVVVDGQDIKVDV